jgi:hypothetical protein
MKRRKPILWIAAVLLLVVPLAFFLRKSAPLDLSKDEEPFRSMVLPLRKVLGAVNESHQSDVRILITDGSGRDLQFWFPLRFDDPWTSYPICYWGEHGSGVGAIEVKDCTRAREIISRLIRNSEIRDKGSISALEHLSKTPPDTWRRICDKVGRLLRGRASGGRDCPF